MKISAKQKKRINLRMARPVLGRARLPKVLLVSVNDLINQKDFQARHYLRVQTRAPLWEVRATIERQLRGLGFDDPLLVEKALSQASRALVGVSGAKPRGGRKIHALKIFGVEPSSPVASHIEPITRPPSPSPRPPKRSKK